MTIRERLEHAKEYGYPVRVVLPNGCIDAGKVKEISGDACMLIEDSGEPCCHIPAIISVEPINDDPDVEIAEIEYGWRLGEGYYCSSDHDQIYWDVFPAGSKICLVHMIGNEDNAKAIAALPDLVRQRDRLLKASKIISTWIEGYPRFSTGEDRGVLCSALDVLNVDLLNTIAEIERNPLIRLTDDKQEVMR